MDSNGMKNMVVLRNLQSNIVEEAFIVFKNNVKIHKVEKIDKNKSIVKKENSNAKDYMIKEAEFIINDYISKIEKREYELGNGNKKIKEKYKRLKALTIFLGMFSILSMALIILK